MWVFSLIRTRYISPWRPEASRTTITLELIWKPTMDTPKIEVLSSGAPVAETHGRCFLPELAPFTIRVSFAKESPMLSEDVSFGVLLWTETPAPHDRKTRKIYSAMFCKEDLEPSDVGLSHYFLGTYKGHDDKKTQLSFRNGLTVATCQCCAPPVTETFSYCKRKRLTLSPAVID